MTIRKADLYNAYRVGGQLGWQDLDKKLTPQAFTAVLNKAKADKDVGALGVAVLQKAYDAAKLKAGGQPTRQEVRAQIDRAEGSLKNETAKGRVNDGYIDAREVKLAKSDVVSALYKYLDVGPVEKSKPTPEKDLKVKASIAQISQAVKTLLPVVDKGFKLYDPNHDDDGDGLSKAMRQACHNAGLSPQAQATIMTALNGSTSRGDGDSGPDAASVKRLITNAQSKLRDSDGALIVDLSSPDKKPTSKKDKTITGLELDRTPAATGMTSRALLAFAATL